MWKESLSYPLVLAGVLGAARLAVPEVVVSEIQYHPHGGGREDEYLEIENRGPEAVDLSGWFFLQGIDFTFPDTTSLAPGERLLVSPDRQHTVERYRVDPERVAGDYGGRLADGGEILELADAAGRNVFRVHYRDGAGWPELADGAGPSLELLSDCWDPDLPNCWRSSAGAWGSPGEPFRAGPVDPSRDVAARAAPWRYFPGTEEPAGGPLAWTEAAYDASSWPEGPEPFGYGTGGLGTTLGAMWGQYTSLYLRLAFTLEEAEAALVEAGAARVSLAVDYDDGFVAYLNGTEVGRARAPGAPGAPVPRDATATAGGTGTASIALSGALAGLAAGTNVVALQGLNRGLLNPDFLLGATVTFQVDPAPRRRPAPACINEVFPGPPEGGGFLEIFNPSLEPAVLDGYRVADGPHQESPYVFAAGTVLPPRGFVALPAGALPFALESDPRVYLLFGPEGAVVEAFAAPPGAAGRSAVRFPDGSGAVFSTATPTEGGPNGYEPLAEVVIHEIQYHPDPASGLEFLELHNPSAEPVPLAGWRLEGGVSFTFPEGTALTPGGFLVVAGDLDAFLAAHPGIAAAGSFSGRLDNDEEEIRLVDPLGNSADEVHYADEGAWPAEADGTGRSIELIHPALDNRYGPAWRAGPGGGSPGAPNASHDPRPPPLVAGVRHEPPIPAPGETVRIRCRVLSTEPVASAEVRWTNDTIGGSGTVPMNDAGAAGDETVGDGVYTGSIPPQADGSTVRFEIAASSAQGIATAPGGGRFYLFEVNSAPFVRRDTLHYTILMTEASWQVLSRRDAQDNTLLDGTFVDHQSGEVYYNVGVRYRGQSSRNPPDGRYSFRIQLTHDRKLEGLKRVNLNAQNTHRQWLANDLFRRAGLPYPQTAPVSLRYRRGVDSRYVRVEPYHDGFLERFFAGDGGGNLYRGIDGELTYRGNDPRSYDGPYRKITNQEENDFSDLVELTRVLSVSDDAEFPALVQERIDVLEWILYFAANGIMGNNENSILLDAGDDYFLYARPSDGRFLILPWDSDSQFRVADQPLFRPSSPAVSRLLHHPDFAPLFFCACLWLEDSAFRAEEIAERLERLAPLHPAAELAEIASFMSQRHDFLERAIPRRLEIGQEAGAATRIIAPGDLWAYWPGTSHPSPGTLAWAELDFDDSAWPVGPSGFGYGDGDDATELAGMRDNYSTVFIRKHFALPEPDRVEAIALIVDYDDAFVAYLNGTEIARRNYDGTIPDHRDTGSRDREAGSEERFPLDDRRDLLLSGENVLALVGLNGTLDSSDLTLIPSLEVEIAGVDSSCARRIVTPLETFRLQGRAPACETRRVLAGGVDALYTPWQARWQIDVPLAPGMNRIEVQALDVLGSVVDSRTLEIVRTGGGTVPESIDTRLVLGRDSSPHVLSGEVAVQPGGVLEVEGGVTLLVETSSRLAVYGELRLLGTPAAPVVFEPLSCSSAWGGIVLDGAQASVEDTRFEGSVSAEALLTARSSRLEIRRSLVADLSAFAVSLEESEGTVEDIQVLRSRGGILASGSALSVTGSLFADLQEGAVLVADSAGRPVEVSRNRVVRGGRAAVTCHGGGARLEQNTIAEATIGVALGEGEFTLAGNILSGCEVGLSLESGAVVASSHNTVASNAVGLQVPSPGAGLEPGRARLDSEIVWGNDFGALSSGEALLEFEYSDTQDRLWPGAGNISADPRFAGPARGDFRLLAGSPAAGTGRDGTDMGALGYTGGAAFFVRGDVDTSGALNLTDPVVILTALFRGGALPECEDVADADDSGQVNLTDPVVLLSHLFRSGPPPRPPFPEAGLDPTEDGLRCEP